MHDFDTFLMTSLHGLLLFVVCVDSDFQFFRLNARILPLKKVLENDGSGIDILQFVRNFRRGRHQLGWASDLVVLAIFEERSQISCIRLSFLWI